MADPESSTDGYATEALRQEMANMTSTQRAAVLMLLLGEEQASDIIRFLNPKEVQALGAAMVQVQDLSQEAINVVLDEFVATIKKQTSLALGTADYVEKVFKRALGDDKAASVLGRISPGAGSKGLEILSWMDARSIADMIQAEHPQVVAIILSVLEPVVAADVLAFLPVDSRAEVIQRVASLETGAAVGHGGARGHHEEAVLHQQLGQVVQLWRCEGCGKHHEFDEDCVGSSSDGGSEGPGSGHDAKDPGQHVYLREPRGRG